MCKLFVSVALIFVVIAIYVVSIPGTDLPVLTIDYIEKNGYPTEVRERYGMFILDPQYTIADMETKKKKIISDVDEILNMNKIELAKMNSLNNYYEMDIEVNNILINDKLISTSKFAKKTISKIVRTYRWIVQRLFYVVEEQIEIPFDSYGNFSCGIYDNTFYGTFIQTKHEQDYTKLTPESKNGTNFFTLIFGDKSSIYVYDKQEERFYRINNLNSRYILVVFGEALSYVTNGIFKTGTYGVKNMHTSTVSVSYTVGPKLNAPIYFAANYNVQKKYNTYKEFLSVCR